MGAAATLPRLPETGNTAGLSAQDIAELNQRYAPLRFDERIAQLYRDFPTDKVLVTSSFAATSAYFLHIISSVQPEQEIAFIDTGYHFGETISYKEFLSGEFGLKVRSLKAEDWNSQPNEAREEDSDEEEPAGDFAAPDEKTTMLTELPPLKKAAVLKRKRKRRWREDDSKG